jgi:phage shock protein PspC (stress-responsive transcriptional regulator)
VGGTKQGLIRVSRAETSRAGGASPGGEDGEAEHAEVQSARPPNGDGPKAMICPHCQRDIADYSNFCACCGARLRATGFRRRLLRSSADSKLGGVCGGIGEYFDIDSTIIRLVWVALSVVPGAFVGGILAYLLAWAVIPKAPLATSAPSATPLEHAAK